MVKIQMIKYIGMVNQCMLVCIQDCIAKYLGVLISTTGCSPTDQCTGVAIARVTKISVAAYHRDGSCGGVLCLRHVHTVLVQLYLFLSTTTPHADACSGHGTCLDMSHMGEFNKVNGVLTPFLYGEDPNDKVHWDGKSMHACMCDAGFRATHK